ncbi:DUF4192 domain-containing protein [Pseudonocardia acaciae]|uniref:DUF4192 domain-containing protein n=1 Tax=Pseudonocardia acaciae TaxID=551276 RepID=UPI000688B3E7|nr:DUF4192 domain-containing protein [Pseudonocardia acaciae]
MNLDTGRPADEQVNLRLRDPADLLIAVPYLLGFHPSDSLVLVGTRADEGVRIELTLRVDLPPPHAVAAVARGVAGGLAARRCDEALVVVVGGGDGEGPPRRDLVDAVTEACAEAGVVVQARAWAAELVAGARWRCYEKCRCAGSLPDPASSPLAPAMVAAGQVTYRDRAELERMVAPADESVLARRSALLDRRVDEASRSGDPVTPSGLAALDLLARWVEDAQSGRLEMDDEDVVDLCLALAEPLVRDAAFGLALGPQALAAEGLWSVLVTEAPDPEAAEPAVLLACCALLRADGALTSVALQRAQQAWPGHRLSAMLQSALEAGLGPDELRDWISNGSKRALALLTRRADPR